MTKPRVAAIAAASFLLAGACSLMPEDRVQATMQKGNELRTTGHTLTGVVVPIKDGPLGSGKFTIQCGGEFRTVFYGNRPAEVSPALFPNKHQKGWWVITAKKVCVAERPLLNGGLCRL